MADGRVPIELSGVPETLLWPLYGRAAEARRSDGILRDPMAIGLVDSIDYPFTERFGEPPQVLALRDVLPIHLVGCNEVVPAQAGGAVCVHHSVCSQRLARNSTA